MQPGPEGAERGVAGKQLLAYGLRSGKQLLAYGLRSGKLLLAYRPMDPIYRAIADPTRRAILDELTERDGQTLFELCTRLTLKHGISSSRQAISQHLAVLEAAGLVITRRAGRSKFHWFDGAPLRPLATRWPIPPEVTEP
jgi:DNA-binding transcriptional ArsR family regulator